MFSYFKFCIVEAYKDIVIATRDKLHYILTADYCPEYVFFFVYRAWRKLDNYIEKNF